jgi:hypothetical protein
MYLYYWHGLGHNCDSDIICDQRSPGREEATLTFADVRVDISYCGGSLVFQVIVASGENVFVSPASSGPACSI